MSLFTTNLNPVGVPCDVLNAKIDELKKVWDSASPKESWWGSKTAHMIRGISFLFNSVDLFILELEKIKQIKVDGQTTTLPGADKKATVLAAIGLLYDYTVRAFLPIYLRPFARRIRSLVIDVLISYAIDFIVEKYKNGLWRTNEEPKEEPSVETKEDQSTDTPVPPPTV